MHILYGVFLYGVFRQMGREAVGYNGKFII